MFGRMVFGVILVVACSKSSELTSTTTSTTAAKPHRIPIIPDSILAQLGAVNIALAVDFSKADVSKLVAILPDEVACTRDLVRSIHVAVLGVAMLGAGTDTHTWPTQGFVTGLPEAATRACLTRIAPMFGFTMVEGSGGLLELQIPGNPLTLAWRGDLAVITRIGHPASAGAPPPATFELMLRVPLDAAAWMVFELNRTPKIKSIVGWLQTRTDQWIITITAEGTEFDLTRSMFESFVNGIKSAAIKKGRHVDDSWFAIESTKTTAKLVMTFPTSAFLR
jgi:hypothetical protein